MVEISFEWQEKTTLSGGLVVDDITYRLNVNSIARVYSVQ